MEYCFNVEWGMYVVQCKIKENRRQIRGEIYWSANHRGIVGMVKLWNYEILIAKLY